MTIPVNLTLPTMEQILDPDQAYSQSLALLLQAGYHHYPPSEPYEGANHTLVAFANGDLGVFVALGFRPRCGYLLLYRIREGKVQLVDLIGSGVIWGIRSVEESDRVGVQWVELFTDAGGQSTPLLQVTGAKYPGPGIWYDGFFHILDIGEDGIHTLFTGAESFTGFGNTTTRTIRWVYEYTDLDGDGVKEIIEQEQDCVYEHKKGEDEAVCEQTPRVFRFDGEVYTQTP